MSEEIIQDLENALNLASSLYYRLVLLVGKSGSGKTKILYEFAREVNLPIVNLNLELSAKLLELAPKERSGNRLLDCMRQIIEQANETILLDNIEILFDCSLHQDPLKLLQGLSRNKIILATWNGISNGARLQYAEPGHPEFRNYESTDAMIINMNEFAGGNL